MADRRRVLFVCTGNSCRSQMAEGWARHLHGEVMEAYSAGTQPRGVDPLAVQVMAEAGVDIRAQRSKGLDSLAAGDFDLVVTVCDQAREACPRLAGARRVVHAGFDDPPKLAASAETREQAMAHYRRVRDDIRAFVDRLPQVLEQPTTEA